jgi:Na+-transporting NADH:ubiquinone oxidoreductase subunit C
MNINSNKYVFGFSIVICLVCGILLSAVTESLRKPQEINAEIEVKKNILKAVGLSVDRKMKAGDILRLFEEKIDEVVVDNQGNIVEGVKPKDIGDKVKDQLPLYIYKENGKIASYAYPIVGQGLWSTLYGYLAIDADATTVRGITFYKHGETPGLGAEIEQAWFQKNFVGKTVYSVKEKNVTPIIVVKGKAADQFQGDKLNYHVDGITAATLTGAGVTDLLNRWINAYEPYFSKVRAM